MYKDKNGETWLNEEAYKEYLEICKKYNNKDASVRSKEWWVKYKEKHKKLYE